MALAGWGAALAALLLSAGAAAAQPSELPVRVVTVTGLVEHFRKGAQAWIPAALAAEVSPGDAVRTLAGGRLVFRTGSGQALRLAQLSQIALLEPPGPEAPPRVRMDAGWLWVAVMPGSPGRARVEVQAGPVLVSVRGSGVAIRANRDGSVLVRVHHGEAVCSGTVPERRWERTLRGQQELLVSAAGGAGSVGSLTRDKAEASWVRWNLEQDHAGEYGGPPPPR